MMTRLPCGLAGRSGMIWQTNLGALFRVRSSLSSRTFSVSEIINLEMSPTTMGFVSKIDLQRPMATCAIDCTGA